MLVVGYTNNLTDFVAEQLMKNAIFSILLQTLEEFKEESPVFLSCPISRHFFPSLFS